MTPFHDLGEFLALPRVQGLCLSPDGERLVAVVQALAADRKSHRTSLWRVDPHGRDEPRRLTRSAEGEGNPAFRPDGTLLFTSARPDPDSEKNEHDTRLWALPADGGEPGLVLDRPGGIEDFAVAEDTGTLVFAASELPGADRERAGRRKEAGVTATLYEGLPVRDWDHHVGPAERRLFVVTGTEEPRDLTPEPGQGLMGQAFAISPDGATVVTGRWLPQPRGERRSELVAIDTATGEQTVLATEDGVDLHTPAISPDGRSVVCVRDRHATYDEARQETLWLVPLDGGEGRDLTAALDRWPSDQVWSPDSRTVYFGAYDAGRYPIFRVDAGSGEIERLTGDDAAYDAVVPAPDGRRVYALRSAIDAPPAPVRLDVTRPEPQPLRLFDAPETPGRVTEVETAEGIRAWLVLPDGAEEPAPLLLWVHGGPHSSWAGWHWRWNPWLMAARGYAVLLPDPALSLGYGQDFVRRGHGTWATPAYEDLMAITDAVVARDDIDGARTAAMGGSYGGYMANWIAGHTDRFQAIVTHASRWPLGAMVTADMGHGLTREFGDPAERPERWTAGDPSAYAGRIRTPMLVIHGDRDYRVPIGHGLWLWSDLMRHEVEAKFLYFPDENHWVLSPGNAAVWYETVFAFLGRHLLGEKWERPDLL
ncbi:S9 family peptidase [Actinomadura sp. DC4]|uniref:S9 family peptidase n=1 Tax=Actinomadura sp. DC4 TaxID=3055069 RepID=UPI0025B0D68F|nr:S9 family peptidase [Actinomadura sp. DC4]MDN3355711.1 S9 family peptidase [Actinomadura sp. DC4]